MAVRSLLQAGWRIYVTLLLVNGIIQLRLADAFLRSMTKTVIYGVFVVT